MSGLEEEFPGRVVAANEDATTAEGSAECEALGFDSHGLVVRRASGEVVLKQPDHNVDVDAVRAALRGLTG